MARTASYTASILTELYDETFSNDSYEPFRITWSNLRQIAGVNRLSDIYLRKINDALNESGYTLVTFDNFLVVTQESAMSGIRMVPPRIVERYLYEEVDDDIEVDEDEVEDEDVEIDDDEVDDDEEEDTDDESGENEKAAS